MFCWLFLPTNHHHHDHQYTPLHSASLSGTSSFTNSPSFTPFNVRAPLGQAYFLWPIGVLAFSVFTAHSYHDLRHYVLDPAHQIYTFQIGDRIAHEGRFHNVYIRLRSITHGTYSCARMCAIFCVCCCTFGCLHILCGFNACSHEPTDARLYHRIVK